MSTAWRQLRMSGKEVSLDWILPSGQSFRWKREGEEWVSVIQDAVIILRNDPSTDNITYCTLDPRSPETTIKHESKPAQIPPSPPKSPPPAYEIDSAVHDYFNSSIKLASLYREFGARDKYFKQIADRFVGIRMLRQDPWECLCSFICSSNNSIKRITQMIDNLCATYGTYIATYKDIDYYTFPRPSTLASSPNCAAKLRELGFGYRADYVYKTAKAVADWEAQGNQLSDMRGKPYDDVREFLLQFTGVGPKVADCVALMSFDCHESVPIDTHVFNIVKRRYSPKTKMVSKTMSKVVYDELSLYLRDLWGPYAGWAQAVIFISELNRDK
ncbi:mitochondrial glycosylase/lyase [Myxozyma melibiosi]|uniref:DNA-(apurinic or apyrimidinic site) lyase n=1 Tax=Myxozyma melibiosi TaxID=54550 RepID=A0ABR1FCZ8_9ASCO